MTTALSIAITTHSRRELFKRSLRSAIRQQSEMAEKIEIIVVNDGEERYPIEVLEELKEEVATKHAPTCKIYQNDGTGVSSARNTAIERANSEYILFLDDDDIIRGGAAASLYKEAKSKDYDFIAGGYLRIKEDKEQRPIAATTHLHQKTPSYDDPIARNRVPLGSYLIKSEIIKTGFRSELGSHEDWAFLLDNLNGRSIACIRELILEYRSRINEESRSTISKERLAHNHIAIYMLNPSTKASTKRIQYLEELGLKSAAIFLALSEDSKETTKKKKRPNASVPLYHWREDGQTNVGDEAGTYLVERLSEMATKNIPHNDSRHKYLTAGSTLGFKGAKNCSFWGSGFISNDSYLDSEGCKIYAVRGQLSSINVNSHVSADCDLPIGDPALLLPAGYTPERKEETIELGIVPHYIDKENFQERVDWDIPKEDCLEIDVETEDVESFIDAVTSCKRIASSSLHGLIIAHAYNIPAIWCKFSNSVIGDGFKFHEYFLSVSIPSYEPVDMTEGTISPYLLGITCELMRGRNRIQNYNPIPLIKSCPFADIKTKKRLIEHFL